MFLDEIMTLNEISKRKIKQQYIDILSDSIPERDIKIIKKLLKNLEGVLNKKKLKHSVNVSSKMSELTNDSNLIISALMHDYLERGGSLDKLPLSKESKKIIKFLTSEEKNDPNIENEPLAHMQEILPVITDKNLKNKVIITKLLDRYDNLSKRVPNVGKGYLQKTVDLITYLRKEFTGDRNILEKVINYFKELLISLKKKKQKLVTI